MFFSIKDELNDETKVYIVVGKRNVGKTYSTVRHIRDIINESDDNQFIYMRRYIKSELDHSKNKVFSNVEDCNIYCDGNIFYNKIGEKQRKICGYAVALSSIPKGIDFEKVKIIFFDEFVITDNKRYLPNEFETFANFLETVIRLRNDCIVVMVGNAKNFYNPYTVGWCITLAKEQKRWSGCSRTIKYMLIEGKEYDNQREETTIGKLFVGTNYDKWANENNFTQNNNINITSKEKNSRCLFTMKTERNVFTVWTLSNGMLVSLSSGNSYHTYQVDTFNLAEGEVLLRKTNNIISLFRQQANKGCIYYESEKIKNEFQPIFNYIVGY